MEIVFEDTGRMQSVLIGDVKIDSKDLLSLTESNLDVEREIELEVAGVLSPRVINALLDDGCRVKQALGMNGQITTCVTQSISVMETRSAYAIPNSQRWARSLSRDEILQREGFSSSSGWCVPNRDGLYTGVDWGREFSIEDIAIEEVIPIEEDNVFAPREVEVVARI